MTKKTPIYTNQAYSSITSPLGEKRAREATTLRHFWFLPISSARGIRMSPQMRGFQQAIQRKIEKSVNSTRS